MKLTEAQIDRTCPAHLARLGIHRPGVPYLPILPPKHVWMVGWERRMPRQWKITRATNFLTYRAALADAQELKPDTA